MHILITAANSQVGSFLARNYLAEGHKLSLFYHKRKERITDLEINSNVFIQAVDLASIEQVGDALNKSTQRFGTSPELLIHCAAKRSYDAKPLVETNPEIFHEVLYSNVTYAYNILKTTLPLMRGSGFGRVILFGSNVTQTGLLNGSAYAAAKAAIANLTKSVALENLDYDFMITCISPAPVDTVLEEDFEGEYLQFRKQYFARYLLDNPGAGLVSKEEIKELIDKALIDLNNSYNGKEIYLGCGVK